MKFSILIQPDRPAANPGENQKNPVKDIIITGFPTIEDAAASMFALAATRRDCFLHLRTAGKSPNYIAGLDPIRLREPHPPTTGAIITTAKDRLAQKRREKKAAASRMKWIYAHGGMETFDRINADPVARLALFKNDFAAVENFLAEPAPPINPLGNTP